MGGFKTLSEVKFHWQFFNPFQMFVFPLKFLQEACISSLKLDQKKQQQQKKTQTLVLDQSILLR